MTEIWGSYEWQDHAVPQEPLDDTERPEYGIPLTLRPVLDPRAEQRPIFDPALKQHANAYRAGDPSFTDPRLQTAWYAARRRAMDEVLAAVADSPWAPHLVLRGSVLLRGWFGEAAREPGDLDFVVAPRDWQIEEERTATMLAELARAAEQRTTAGAPGVLFSAADAVSEPIWTYDRVPGCRLVLPWTAEGLPGGTVQLDFVFNERLPQAPERTPVAALAEGPGCTLTAVTPALSLAWKLLWLLTDMYPQGKDLYDAVLLAETTPLRYELLREVFLDAGGWWAAQPVTTELLAQLRNRTEWEHFESEYPQIEADLEECTDRLIAALAPTFAGAPAPEERQRWWTAAWVTHYRARLETSDLATLLRELAGDGAALPVVIVLVRAVLGHERHTLEEARDLVLADPSWARAADRYEADPRRLARQLAELAEPVDL
ncbi:nucleotidyl transferase AbiEii/AbiGii toxin family protein [Kitasatospora nipponensis]|uniref:Nucleotidyl transferase AbiEii/AbiGii toxin family protein n=1 Tax=Kitasatospora nipponensis TaxID=258049 RepID=A0ABN1WUN2_9ACTN